jgi:hypothetical protein
MIGRSPSVAQRHTPTRSHGDDPSHARATATRLACRPHSTSHRVLRSARGGGPAPRRDRSPPPPAPGAGTATPPYAPVGSRVPFFEFFHHCGRTDVQHACSIANATGIPGHLDHLLLHLKGLPRVGLLLEKCPPASQATRPASGPLLAFSGHAMAHNIRPVAGGTMRHLRHHGLPIQSWSLSSSNRGYQINSSESETPSASDRRYHGARAPSDLRVRLTA